MENNAEKHDSEEISCIKFYYTPILRSFSPLRDFISIVRLKNYIRKNRFDIVIGHTPKGALLGMLASKLAGTSQRIYYRHGLIYETAKGIRKTLFLIIEKLTGYAATKVVSVSPSILHESCKNKLNNNDKNILIGKRGSINGVDSDYFNKMNIAGASIEDLKKKLRIPENKLVVGFVGRFTNDKGLNELLEAWRKLIIKRQDIILLVVGKPDSRDSISFGQLNYIKNESSIIHIAKEINMSIMYALMDIFILPTYREGLPTVILEASSMELPIITTPVTGCVDVIIENKTGIFCQNNDDNIVEKIQYYLNNPLLRIMHGKNGREFIIENFKPEEIWKETAQKLYN